MAIVSPAPNPLSGTIRGKRIKRADGTVKRTKEAGEGEIAITHYTTIRQLNDLAVLRVRLETGRKHQIRAQLRSAAHPSLATTCTTARHPPPA